MLSEGRKIHNPGKALQGRRRPRKKDEGISGYTAAVLVLAYSIKRRYL